ncbi:MAG: 50S ribosomal protein L17 [Bacteroidota bacterium]|nr:50S ribosomal protein L17 [Bacteroidota bacterium]
MVHRKKGRKLQRTASHRSALLSNLSISLILNKRIHTTEAKAKELRRFIEPLVSKAKKALTFKDSAPEKGIHLRREARKFLNNKEALIILFDEIGAKVGDRPGGYTRVLKTGNRYGDGAQTAIIEFVDYNYVKAKEEKIKEKEASKNPDVKVEKKSDQKEDIPETKKSLFPKSKTLKSKTTKSDVKKTDTSKSKKKKKEDSK